MIKSKYAAARKDYRFNWTSWLDGDTILSSEWTVPSGLVMESEGHDETTTTVWISGGTPGESYVICNTIETAAGRLEPHYFTLRIKS
jgi:hypothetical protein